MIGTLKILGNKRELILTGLKCLKSALKQVILNTLYLVVVKSFLAMPNGNANVERSLSDNKNTLTSERTSMTKGTLEGLRRAKEYARSCGGAYNMNTLSRGEF